LFMSLFGKSSEPLSDKVFSRRKLMLATLTIAGSSLLQVGCGSSKNTSSLPNTNPGGNTTGSNGAGNGGSTGSNGGNTNTGGGNSGGDANLPPEIVPGTPGTRSVKWRIQWPAPTRYFAPKTQVVKIEGVYSTETSEYFPIGPVLFTRPQSGNESVFEWTAPTSSSGLSIQLRISTHVDLNGNDGPQTFDGTSYGLLIGQRAERTWLLEALPSKVDIISITPFDTSETAPQFSAQAFVSTFQAQHVNLTTDTTEWEWRVDSPSDFRLESQGSVVKAVRLTPKSSVLHVRHIPSNQETTYVLKNQIVPGGTKEDLQIPYVMAQVSEDEQAIYAINPQSKTPYKWTKETGTVAMETGFDTLPFGYHAYGIAKNGAVWGTVDKNGKTIFIKYANEKNAVLLENLENTWGPRWGSPTLVNLSEDYSVVTLLPQTSPPRSAATFLYWTRQTGWQDIPPTNDSIKYDNNAFKQFISGSATNFTLYTAAYEAGIVHYSRWKPNADWETITLDAFPQEINNLYDLSLAAFSMGTTDILEPNSTIRSSFTAFAADLGLIAYIQPGTIASYVFQQSIQSVYISKNDPTILFMTTLTGLGDHKTYRVHVPNPITQFRRGTILWRPVLLF
jgi:hypothetical protein